jgi:hypothetical protein
MKLTFRQSGGFAGLTRGCELDTADLPATQAAKVQKLVEVSGVRAQRHPSPSGLPDVTTFRIRIEDESGNHEVVLEDATLSPKASALVEFFQKRSKPRPPT